MTTALDIPKAILESLSDADLDALIRRLNRTRRPWFYFQLNLERHMMTRRAARIVAIDERDGRAFRAKR